VDENIYMEIIGDLVRIIKDKKEVGEWMECKIRENIELKFRLIKNNAKGVINEF